MQILEVTQYTHKIFSGVCASLGTFLKIDPSIVRLIFIISGFLSYLTFIFYVVATIIIPKSDDESSSEIITSNKSIFHVSFSLLLLLFILLFYYLNIPIFTFSIKLPLLISFFTQLFIIVLILTFIFYRSESNNIVKKDSSNKIISGVLSGIANKQKMDVSIVRLFYILLLTFFNFSSVILITAYLFLSVTLEHKDSSDNLT